MKSPLIKRSRVPNKARWSGVHKKEQRLIRFARRALTFNWKQACCWNGAVINVEEGLGGAAKTCQSSCRVQLSSSDLFPFVSTADCVETFNKTPDTDWLRPYFVMHWGLGYRLPHRNVSHFFIFPLPSAPILASLWVYYQVLSSGRLQEHPGNYLLFLPLKRSPSLRFQVIRNDAKGSKRQNVYWAKILVTYKPKWPKFITCNTNFQLQTACWKEFSTRNLVKTATP